MGKGILCHHIPSREQVAQNERGRAPAQGDGAGALADGQEAHQPGTIKIRIQRT